jgi:endonuclease/exonuclease/phosphatase (EEP) superfamily protein YafD
MTLCLAIVAVLRVLWHDATVPLVWLNAFTLYIYLPAYVVLAIAMWKRRWLLAVASGAVVGCHVMWVAPDFRPPTPFEPPLASSADAPSLRIFYANVRMGNLDVKGFYREIAAADPDVIVLVEIGRWWYEEMRKLPAFAPYQYGTSVNNSFLGDVAVFSRRPTSRLQLVWAQDRLNCVLDIPLGEVALRLFCLHSPRPLAEAPSLYRAFWRETEPMLAEQREPLVVIGDFNATQHSQVYKRLTSGRLRSAHEDRGRGYATTWPNRYNPLPPIRIDHALLSPQVECVSIVEGLGKGSDHKPLVLDVRVHPPGRPSNPAIAER